MVGNGAIFMFIHGCSFGKLRETLGLEALWHGILEFCRFVDVFVGMNVFGCGCVCVCVCAYECVCANEYM